MINIVKYPPSDLDPLGNGKRYGMCFNHTFGACRQFFQLGISSDEIANEVRCLHAVDLSVESCIRSVVQEVIPFFISSRTSDACQDKNECQTTGSSDILFTASLNEFSHAQRQTPNQTDSNDV